jgi:hypothetical protein
MALTFPSALFAQRCGVGNAQQIAISETFSDGAFTIASANDRAPIVVDAADAEVVSTAAVAVKSDIAAVTGTGVVVKNTLAAGDLPIIAGTIGSSSFIDTMVSNGTLDVSDVKGQWESYGLQIVSNPLDGIVRALVIYGADPRGTAYGLFELSHLMGVSPYIWWADVKPATKTALYATGAKSVVASPSVKFRGIFINDEDWGLKPWAAKNMDPDRNNMGPNTYAKVMELLLRLRANTLWPAMHYCSEAFWANKGNLPVAKKYDIVLGSSHCEQMLRDNEWEWRKLQGLGDTEWNWSTNSEKVKDYWAKRVGESRGYDAMYTLGMRGVHDSGINGYSSTADKVRGLTDIIAYQRQLITDSLGDATTIPQIFIPYKEVLDAYNAGLKVPDDVTLCWVDDNHGYIRQLPTSAEQARSGGNGIYYHLSYLGTPASWLWLSSLSPSLASFELSKGYQYGMRNLWVINVGDIKPAEEELQFCMDLAWDINAWSPEKAYGYTRHWAAETFGEQYADAISDIKLAYYRLAASGKPEHLFKVSYNDEEKDRRIRDYEALSDKVDNLKGSIPSTLQDAYYELIEYPVKAACNMNIKTFRAAESMTLAQAGQHDQALAYAAEARKAYRQIQTLTTKYNEETAGGKWNGIMSMKPNDATQFSMPETATLSSISNISSKLSQTELNIVPAIDFTASSGNLTTLKGLGISDNGVTVWPMDTKAYSGTNLSGAPYAEYDVNVKTGINTIQVRCLPSFPVNSSYDLRIAIAVDGSTPQVCSLKTTAMAGKWNTTVIQGFNDGTVNYTSTKNKTVKVRVYLLDPGVVLSEIDTTQPVVEDLTLTQQLIKNYDFECNSTCQQNAVGTIGRGIPCGWQSVGTLKKGANGLYSYGVNQDAIGYHGDNVCWINSNPMPDYFELSQTIPATSLKAGVYKVSCKLWVEEGKKTNCRLFANKNVQYYGSQSDYTHLLTAGEENSYAGYAGGSSSSAVLKDMAVYVIINKGDALQIGIKTSNKKSDGTSATDNSGWFKVDYFRVEKVGKVPAARKNASL